MLAINRHIVSHQLNRAKPHYMLLPQNLHCSLGSVLRVTCQSLSGTLLSRGEPTGALRTTPQTPPDDIYGSVIYFRAWCPRDDIAQHFTYAQRLFVMNLIRFPIHDIPHVKTTDHVLEVKGQGGERVGERGREKGRDDHNLRADPLAPYRHIVISPVRACTSKFASFRHQALVRPANQKNQP